MNKITPKINLVSVLITPAKLLVLTALVLSACTRDPAQTPLPPAPEVTLMTDDTSKLLLNGELTTLVGFDLGEDSTAANTPQLLKQLAKAGGNLLVVDSTHFTRKNWRELRVTAATEGVVLAAGDQRFALSTSASAKGFIKLLLEGQPAVALTTYGQGGLNLLRSIRTVERHLKFTDLNRNNDVLAANNRSRAVAADDGVGNYAIYTPTVDMVAILLDEEQVPRRVTVVGHLGTQRSEILNPPYDRSFTVLSNDEKGGWLIIKKLTE